MTMLRNLHEDQEPRVTIVELAVGVSMLVVKRAYWQALCSRLLRGVVLRHSLMKAIR